MDQNGVSWQAPDFMHAERSPSWYLWSMGFALLLIVVAFWQKNILFALFILIAEIMLLLVSYNAPDTKLYALSSEGLSVDGRLLRLFVDANGFGFFDLGGRYIELVIRPNKKIATYTKVLVPRERLEEVKGFLAMYLHPFEYTPALADTMAKWLRI